MTSWPALLQQRWDRLAPRERLAVGVAGAVVLSYLLWAVAWAPAWRALQTLPAQQSRADAQLAQMRALAETARSLEERQRSEPLPRDAALRALEAASQQTLGPGARVQALGDRVTVTVSAVTPDALAQWLSQTRLNARLMPIDAQLQRNGEGSAVRWSGSVVLHGPSLREAP